MNSSVALRGYLSVFQSLHIHIFYTMSKKSEGRKKEKSLFFFLKK